MSPFCSVREVTLIGGFWRVRDDAARNAERPDAISDSKPPPPPPLPVRGDPVAELPPGGVVLSVEGIGGARGPVLTGGGGAGGPALCWKREKRSFIEGDCGGERCV